jgi:hypothetical protein
MAGTHSVAVWRPISIVSALTIQGILRHSSLATTQAIYIKTVAADAVEAMRVLNTAMQ